MKKIVALCIFACAFVAVSAFAQQNKVVVVPLGSASKMTAAAAGGNQEVIITGQSLRSVTITAPVEGIVIVNASCDLNATGAAGSNFFVQSSISASASVDGTAQMSYGGNVNTSTTGTAISQTRAFAVSAGTYTYHLYAQMYSGTATARDSSINALFVPVASPAITTAPVSATSTEQVCSESENPFCLPAK